MKCEATDCGNDAEFDATVEGQDTITVCAACVDALYIHWPARPSDIPEWIDELIKWPGISINRSR